MDGAEMALAGNIPVVYVDDRELQLDTQGPQVVVVHRDVAYDPACKRSRSAIPL